MKNLAKLRSSPSPVSSLLTLGDVESKTDVLTQAAEPRTGNWA
jgi:hypothetical protein